MKRIVTIQDISCVGKCSLTVALPIISAMGVETSVLPTAVLSTHTAFTDFTFCDLTGEIKPIADHWLKEKISFDALYSGYLGSFEQLELVSDLFMKFKTDDNIVFIDPVMGDYGKLYAGFTPEFAGAMAELCSKADIIVPNMTEAAYMLDIDYVESGYSEQFVQDILRRLSDRGTPYTVLTGVQLEEGRLGVMSYDARRDSFFSYYNDKIEANYHGTGDVFASCCVGALMNGLTLEKSLQLAADFTVASIADTVADPEGNWYGVNFESALPELLRRIGK